MSGKWRRYLNVPSRDRARIRRDVEDEFQTHLALRAEELSRNGMAVDEARTQALREFGDLDDATGYCTALDRDTERRLLASQWLSDLRHDAAHTLRVLRRAPSFAVATIVTLALAIAASTSVYSVLHAYLVRPLPFPASDRLMSVVPAPSLAAFPRMPSLRDVDWRKVDSLFEATAAWDLDGFTIPGEQHADYVDGAWVSEGFFRALGLAPAIGRGFQPDEYRGSAPIAIISHDLWTRRFGANPAIVGTTITLHSTDRPREASVVTIVGVTPRGFWPINRFTDVLRPLPEPRMPSLARLTPGVTRVEAQARLDAVVRAQLTGDVDPAWHMSLMPAGDEHAAQARPVLLAVFGAALFMLLAACGSVSGALTSRLAARRTEVAIRLALGGSRARIVRQLVTESAVLALVAGAMGIMLAVATLDAFGPVIERYLGATAPGGTSALRPSMSVVAWSVALCGAIGVVVGLIPASLYFGAGRGDTTLSLSASRGAAGRTLGGRLRRTLIAGQVAVAMVLLFGAGLMFRTLDRMSNTDLGFRADGVMKATVLFPATRYADSAARRQVMARLLDAVAATPGVRSAAAVFPHPFRDAASQPVVVEGSDASSPPVAVQYTVSHNYFETMELRVVHGRTIRATDDHAAPLVVVIGEGLARTAGGSAGAIGRRVRVGGADAPWRTVIGVVRDTKKSFTPDAVSDIYVPYAQNPRAYQSIVARTDRGESTIFEPAKRAVALIDPVLALADVESLDDVVARVSAQRRGITTMLTAFAVFALGLSALALYASLSYAVLQRRPELAVRMAVGATSGGIVQLVLREGLTTAAIGVGIGGVSSVALGRVLETQLYGVGSTDPLTLVVISIVLILAAAAACLAPSLEAARTDPALALRE
jgi:putative ABC transport system permease protein